MPLIKPYLPTEINCYNWDDARIEKGFENKVQRLSGSRYVFDKGKGGQKTV